MSLAPAVVAALVPTAKVRTRNPWVVLGVAGLAVPSQVR